MALATQPGIAVNANIMCQTNMISLREKYFPQIDKAPASQPAVTWQKVFLCHEQCLKCSETNLRWQYMYVGGLICQKTVDWSHFGSSEVIQRFCPRSQRVVATVCLFVKSGVKWHLLTNRQTVTLSSIALWWSTLIPLFFINFPPFSTTFIHFYPLSSTFILFHPLVSIFNYSQ